MHVFPNKSQLWIYYWFTTNWSSNVANIALFVSKIEHNIKILPLKSAISFSCGAKSAQIISAMPKMDSVFIKTVKIVQAIILFKFLLWRHAVKFYNLLQHKGKGKVPELVHFVAIFIFNNTLATFWQFNFIHVWYLIKSESDNIAICQYISWE